MSRRNRAGGQTPPTSSQAVRQTNGRVTQMGHGWIESRLVKATNVLLARKMKAEGYSRHVLFFSIPHAVAHAEALIQLAVQQQVPHEFHGTHEVTREWLDADIDKVVDNRAGFYDESRNRK